MDEQPEKVLPYHFIEPSQDQSPHQHFYKYTDGGEHVVRHCECGQSWVLVRLPLPEGVFYAWKETKEWNEI